MIKTINDLKPGEYGKIKELSGDKNYMKRFMEMGFIPGSLIFLQKKAPFGGPLKINIKNYNLAIRKEDANMIYVE